MSFNKDQDLLQVITAINIDLRRDASFRNLLEKLDDAAQRRVAKEYVEWIMKIIQQEKHEPN
jgi:hypothetical protein